MGERKGTNKYYPPDYNPKKGGLNKFLGTHALRERARKIHLGILIIRFEMPYNIWCEGCNQHIGMGVRFNAEKKKIGMYYSTPIYQFRMKCHLCDNHFEIKTDPGNLDYVIVSGARRQDNRWDPTENEQIVPETKETQKKLFDDAMYKLEHELNDVKKADIIKPNLEKLYERNFGVWNDSYEANCRLRANFRTQKKEVQKQQEKDKEILTRNSLNINLLPENENDRKMAALMKLQTVSANEREKEKRYDIISKPALPGVNDSTFAKLKKKINIKFGLKNSIVKNSNDLTTRKAIFKKCRKPSKLLDGIITEGNTSKCVHQNEMHLNEGRKCDEKNSNAETALSNPGNSIKSLVENYSSSSDTDA